MKEELKNIFLMGLGAMSMTNDKAQELKKELLAKGEKMLEKGKVANEELKHNIKETLKENVVHPTAEYLYGILQEKAPNISLATLYRNLNQLAENGIIKKIDGLEAPSHFDHNTHEHFHFICDKCKRVLDVSINIAPDVVQRTKNETGFDVKGYDITLHGICNECKSI